MSFPTFVYRSPGPYVDPASSGAYRYEVVNDADEMAARLKDGWFKTYEEAIDAAGDIAFTWGRKPRKVVKRKKPAPVAQSAPAPVDNSPATRDEMLEQAEKIGLKVDKRWSDDTLMQKITEHMDGLLKAPIRDGSV